MPKETIKSDTGPYDVRIGWDRFGSVQVGVEGNEGRSLLWLLYGDLQQRTELGKIVDELAAIGLKDEELGAELLNRLDLLSGFGDRGYVGVWSDLNRNGCNRVIKLIRKARDASFGKDE